MDTELMYNKEEGHRYMIPKLMRFRRGILLNEIIHSIYRTK